MKKIFLICSIMLILSGCENENHYKKDVENVINDTVNQFQEKKIGKDDKIINNLIELSSTNLWDNAIENGVQINGYKKSTFRYAVENGTRDFAYYIIDHGVDMKYLDKKGQNELMYLNSWIYTPVYDLFVTKMVQNGCNINAKDLKNHTVLEDAIIKSSDSLESQQGERKKIESLLKNGAELNENIIQLLSDNAYLYYSSLKMISDRVCSEFSNLEPNNSLEAVLLNDEEYLLGNPLNLPKTDSMDISLAFYTAALGTEKELEKAMRELNLSFEIRDGKGNTLLMAAAAAGNEGTYDYLKDKISSKIKNDNSETVLTAALCGENTNIVKLVFDNNDGDWSYDTENAEDFKCFTQLIDALSYYHDDSFLKMYLSSVKLTDFDLQRLCQILIQNKNDVFLEKLLKHPIAGTLSSNFQICESIMELCSTEKQTELVLNFVSADIREKMLPALSVILYRQSGNIIEESERIVMSFNNAGIDLGKDVSAIPAILAATHTGDTKAVIKLIEQGADVNAAGKNDGRTPLMAAAMGDYKLLQILLDHGAEVDETDNSDNVALRYAIGWSSPECVRLLLDYGADKHIKTPEGSTLYEVAVKKNNKEIIDMLSD